MSVVRVIFVLIFVSFWCDFDHCVSNYFVFCHILRYFCVTLCHIYDTFMSYYITLLHFMPLFVTLLPPFRPAAALALLRNEQGFSALHICSLHNHVDIARALLSRGADPSAQTRYGATALHLACQYGSEPVVIALIESKVRKVL